MNFYNKLFYFCLDENIITLKNYNLLEMDSKWDCLNGGGEWMKYESDFNDLGSTLAVLFTISQTFAWTTPMY